MEFYEVVHKRRSIRQFMDKAIPQEILKRILDAGLKAPSSNHQRSWELVIYTDKEKIKELAHIVKPYSCTIHEPKSPQQDMFKIAYPRQRTMIEESACVILPYFKCKYGLTNPNGYGLMDYGAAWALIENMLLAATAEGLGSVVHIPVKKEGQQIDEYVGAKNGYLLPAMVILGYAAPDALTPKQVEVTVEKKAHWNRW